MVIKNVYRTILEKSGMINNDEWTIYTNREIKYEECKATRLVISRPVLQEEVDAGLVIITTQVSCFKEKVPDITLLLDCAYRFKNNFINGQLELFRSNNPDVPLEKVLAHFIAYQYYDCMSGSMPAYMCSVCRYVIQNIPDCDMETYVYPCGKGEGSGKGDKYGHAGCYYNLKDFMEHTKDCKPFEEIMKNFQILLPEMRQLLLPA